MYRCGYRGEGITDESVWIVKSHFPERYGFIRYFVSRVILVVRNPFDAIESYFHMGFTNTHNKNLSEKVGLDDISFRFFHIYSYQYLVYLFPPFICFGLFSLDFKRLLNP